MADGLLNIIINDKNIYFSIEDQFKWCLFIKYFKNRYQMKYIETRIVKHLYNGFNIVFLFLFFFCPRQVGVNILTFIYNFKTFNWMQYAKEWKSKLGKATTMQNKMKQAITYWCDKISQYIKPFVFLRGNVKYKLKLLLCLFEFFKNIHAAGKKTKQKQRQNVNCIHW